jgi:hypothetical protein
MLDAAKAIVLDAVTHFTPAFVDAANRSLAGLHASFAC